MATAFQQFYIAKLSSRELENVRASIEDKQDDGVKPKKIISSLQGSRKKLKEEWKAERVYRTEAKKIETDKVKAAAKKFGENKFKVLLNRSACEACKKFSNNEQRVFTAKEISEKKIPHHPNCLCKVVIWSGNN